jgi:hypothetical protein
MFEVEAMRDGRLGDPERARFGRHMTVCPACTREVQALEALAEALRVTSHDGAGLDELHVCRERNRLLAAFDRALVAPARHRGVRRWLPLPLTLAALAAGLLIVWQVRPVVQPVRVSRAIVRADSTAVWSKGPADDIREEIILERGALWIHVDHSSAAGRLVVVLPDGELEDTGTTFMVSVEEGHTVHVAVVEGSVVLRIRGRAAVAIGPGKTWTPDTRISAATGASLAPRPEPPPSRRLSPPRRAVQSPRLPAQIDSALPDPSVDFRAAVAALHDGDNQGAAAAFTTFLLRHPRDGRAEDAAYLRVIALQRSGAGVDMKRAAEDYLRWYPTGFRHAEVERLVRIP